MFINTIYNKSPINSNIVWMIKDVIFHIGSIIMVEVGFKMGSPRGIIWVLNPVWRYKNDWNLSQGVCIETLLNISGYIHVLHCRWVLFIQIFQILIAKARTTYVEMYYLQTVKASLFTVQTETQTRLFCLYKGRLKGRLIWLSNPIFLLKFLKYS